MVWADSDFLRDTAARLSPSADLVASQNMAAAPALPSPRQMAPAAGKRVTSAHLATAAPNMAIGT